MFLTNVLEILGIDSPIQLILKMNGAPWRPGDFIQKGLYALQLYHSVGINSFVVQNDMGILAAQLMAVLDNAELSKVQYSDYSELLIENQTKSK